MQGTKTPYIIDLTKDEEDEKEIICDHSKLDCKSLTDCGLCNTNGPKLKLCDKCKCKRKCKGLISKSQDAPETPHHSAW